VKRKNEVVTQFLVIPRGFNVSLSDLDVSKYAAQL
jgi:hypothetical protein